MSSGPCVNSSCFKLLSLIHRPREGATVARQLELATQHWRVSRPSPEGRERVVLCPPCTWPLFLSPTTSWGMTGGEGERIEEGGSRVQPQTRVAHRGEGTRVPMPLIHFCRPIVYKITLEVYSMHIFVEFATPLPPSPLHPWPFTVPILPRFLSSKLEALFGIRALIVVKVCCHYLMGTLPGRRYKNASLKVFYIVS